MVETSPITSNINEVDVTILLPQRRCHMHGANHGVNYITLRDN